MKDSDWRRKPFHEFAVLQRGFDLPASKRRVGRVPILAANGIVGYHDEAKVCGPGVATGRSGTVGKVIFVKDDFWPLNTSLYVKEFHDNDPEFVFRFLEFFRLERFSTGTGVPTLNRNIVHEEEVFVPPVTEQRAVAEVIRCWDSALSKLETLVTARIQLKRGLMQQLLTGKKQFHDFAGQKWRSMPISDFTVCHSRSKTKPDELFTALGIRSHGKGTFLKKGFDPQKIEMTELYEVKENDLIVNITFAWEGAIAIAKANDTGALVSHRFPTYEFNTQLAIPEFFRHVIVQKWFVEKLGLVSPGGAGRNRVLSKKDFVKIEVLMPSVEEQRRIAEVLNACDTEIELLRKQLETLERQKRGLMQKLLTAQIRVKGGRLIRGSGSR